MQPCVVTERCVVANPLTLRQRESLKEHSRKNMSYMKDRMENRMENGDNFKDAHVKATRRVGK